MGKKQKKADDKEKNSNEYAEDEAEGDQMTKLFAFSEFYSSKNQSHVDSDLSGVFKGKQVKRVYTQYMNRRGGFNRNGLRQSEKK